MSDDDALARFPPGARVRCPDGTHGTVEAVSLRLRAAVLVWRDDQLSRSYPPEQLRVVAMPGGQQSQTRGTA